MTLCYYVTGHGYGHAIRTTQILKALPPDVRLVLKTTVPERLFREELPGRDFTYLSAEYDCGCVQRDSVTVLAEATLARYREIAALNQRRRADEVDFLRREGVRCVVSDIPPFPLLAARDAGIPGVAVANFTWYDIYREYARTPSDAALLEAMAAEYGAAAIALITPLSTPAVAAPFPRAAPVPLVARRGRDVRASLAANLGRLSGRQTALLYLGNWGLQIEWPALARLRGWAFVSFEPPPDPVENVITLDRGLYAYADVAASVDAVISKAGYGIVTECIANGVPLVYVPRAGFAEYPALVEGMRRWGGGIEIPEADFFAGRWQAALEAAEAARPDPDAYETDGASVVAEELMRTMQ